MPSVRFEDLEEAFAFVSADPLQTHEAYLSLDTGQIQWISDGASLDDEDLPEDLETSDRYIAVPHKNELGLGRELALSFIDRELPGDYNTAAGFFRRKDAYGRFKQLLHSRNMLQRSGLFNALFFGGLDGVSQKCHI